MRPEEVKMAEYLKESGYKTALFDKRHLGYYHPMRPVDQGFDFAVIWDALQLSRVNPLWKMSERARRPSLCSGRDS